MTMFSSTSQALNSLNGVQGEWTFERMAARYVGKLRLLGEVVERKHKNSKEVQQSVYEAAVEIRKRFQFFCRRSRYMKEAETPAKQRPKISRKGGDRAAHWGNLLLDLGLIEKNSLQWEEDEFQRLYGVTFQQAELVLGESFFPSSSLAVLLTNPRERVFCGTV
jgi:hypothetical protein